MSWIVYIAKLISPNFIKLAKVSNQLQLITIAISHYCEIARWSLDIKDISYNEYDTAPFQHVFPTLALRLANHNPNNNKSSNETKKSSVKNLTVTPVAVETSGNILNDSWDIATFSGLASIDEELKIFLNEIIGPLTRQLVYYYILKSNNTNIWNRLCTENRNILWKCIWYLGLGSYVKKRLSITMKSYDEVIIKDCQEKLMIAIQKLDCIIEQRAKLRNNNELIPTKDMIDIGDIAIASLIAPLVNPPAYCKGNYTNIFDDLMSQDYVCKASMFYWRNTITGQYTMLMYSKYRMK